MKMKDINETEIEIFLRKYAMKGNEQSVKKANFHIISLCHVYTVDLIHSNYMPISVYTM